MTDTPEAHLLIIDDDERIRGLLQKFFCSFRAVGITLRGLPAAQKGRQGSPGPNAAALHKCTQDLFTVYGKIQGPSHLRIIKGRQPAVQAQIICVQAGGFFNIGLPFRVFGITAVF